MFNIFKKKQEGSTRGEQYLSLRIRNIVKETPDTITIFFEQPEPYLDYKPGQFLTVILDVEGKEVRRSYSLCTSPFMDPYPGITVKRVKEGLISNYLNDQLRPGKTIEVMKPLGNFTTGFHSKNRNHFVMIAAGSGITPIMGILKSILINEPASKISLLYCNRSEDQIIFRNELDQLQEKYPDSLKVIHNLSQPNPSWEGHKGRLDAENLKSMLASDFFPNAAAVKYFVCGPEGLMKVVLETLTAMGISQDMVFKESFFTSEKSGKKNIEVSKSDDILVLTREVEVVLEGESHFFDVSPGQTILESGLDKDINMPYSCQSGLCTACRGKLISGKVSMNEDAGLSEGELAQGYILCCSSKPASSGIKILIE